jgi:hypothetical protein
VTSALRAAAAAALKPKRIQVLLVAEAPPSAVDRYFYFPDVREQDSLFRYVARGMLGIEPTRANKPELLARLCKAGVFLIDLCVEPLVDAADVPRCVDDLVERAGSLAPQQILLIKMTVYRAALVPLQTAGLPVVDEPIPFPGSGQQLRFVESFDQALRSIGWAAPD